MRAGAKLQPRLLSRSTFWKGFLLKASTINARRILSHTKLAKSLKMRHVYFHTECRRKTRDSIMPKVRMMLLALDYLPVPTDLRTTLIAGLGKKANTKLSEINKYCKSLARIVNEIGVYCLFMPEVLPPTFYRRVNACIDSVWVWVREHHKF